MGRKKLGIAMQIKLENRTLIFDRTVRTDLDPVGINNYEIDQFKARITVILQKYLQRYSYLQIKSGIISGNLRFS